MRLCYKWSNRIAVLCLTLFSSITLAITADDFPATVQLVGRDEPITTANILQRRPAFLLVCSHATADLIKAVPAAWLAQGMKIPADRFIAVAAVSKAPWLVKKLFIGAGLSGLVEERTAAVGKQIPEIGKAPVVVDMEGDMVSALRLKDLDKHGFAVFIIDPAGAITPLLRSRLQDDSDTNINAAAGEIVRAVAPYFGAKP